MSKSLLNPTVMARFGDDEDYLHELIQHNHMLRRAIVLILTVLSLAAFLAIHRSKLLEYKCQYVGLPYNSFAGLEQPNKDHFIVISASTNMSRAAKDRWLGT
ncbi:hypothetical protein F5Y00DRAFT_257273 [Daldinia vernicosa]|uniref:uncharacterized protein n=1 Tax=Daldinia vernicosa TaxID=114800 RepID=UPI0020074FAC|nr:uncharacterized protein F5Y00DRAFT_257273 [Daldinia vernicosa]KAI0853976.1 hypothetical protein F5Y00DRAFT_257273 [Daldinia vernicosa]